MTGSTIDVVGRGSQISVTLDHRRVLDGVTLDLPAGTVTVLAGPNGAGKTTLIRVFSGSIVPAGGVVTVMGHVPSRDHRVRACLGLVPQEIALYSRLTVRENIEIFAAFAGAPVTSALVGACLAQTGLENVADRLVSTVSGGYQRRANIACALVGKPRLLLLDEPLVGLDPLARRAICADLRALAQADGVALLLATHDLDDAETIADRVVILQAGRITAQASPADLVARAFSSGAIRTELVLIEAPDEETGRSLKALGYSATAEPTIWRGLCRAGGSALPEDAGPDVSVAGVRELRHRRLRLADAYEAIVASGEVS